MIRPSSGILMVFMLSCGTLAGFAQKKELTQDQLLKNKMPALTSPLPFMTGWSDDAHLVLRKKDGTDTTSRFYMVAAKSGSEIVMDNYKEVPKKTKQVYIKNDDIYLMDGDKPEVRLTNDKDKEQNPTLSPDQSAVAYTKNNNLYILTLSGSSPVQVTNDGSEVILNGYASWVYTEEILGRASMHRSFWWSPDSKRIVFFRTDDSPVPVYTITDGNGQHGYVEKERYPKVGDPNPEVKIGITDLAGHITWTDFNPKDDQYFGLPYWTPTTNTLLVQWLNRDQNNLKIWEVDPTTGTKKEFYNEKQKTWIDLDDEGRRITFLKNGKGFILQSDHTGWNHLYYYNMNGKLMNPVTSGKFTVTAISYIDEKNGIVYFTARGRENTARTDAYSVKLNGKEMKRLTFGDYNHTVVFSPEGSYFVTTYSNATTPAKMAIVSNAGKLIKELGDSKGPEYYNYNIAKTELIRVKSDDGLYNLPAMVTWPANMDPNKHYPVLVSIYGGPNAGTVMDRFALTPVQQWYAKEGLIQISMDHRASGHFGKEGVNYMYHNLGYWEMKDYSTIVKYLIDKGYADPKKICITGFSYGGYMTCYALTYGADVFNYGMAGGSVTDWSLYDSHYTERYMGTPANNPEGYKTSSVLTYTDRYKGMLQIVHGVIDDNVHMQNSLQLITKLENAKKDFEFMVYPGGRHGWRGAQQAHFQNLKTKFIYRYLLDKPVPQDLLW